MGDPREPAFVDLIWLLEMTHDEYVSRFRGTAARRAKHWMLQRNAAVALGNVGSADALPALDRAMRGNPHPIVRGHAAWAIGRIGSRHRVAQAVELLRSALDIESDPVVREEIELALAETSRP
jgi:epoxyqueuosine reductase